ncbi:MAG: sodium:solute symporter [Armatimonadota bacterium]
MTTLDFIVVAAYFVGIAALGVYQSVRIRSSGDYFAGGRKFNKFLMMMHALGSGTHADDPVGVTGTALQRGMSGIWWTYCYLFATPVYWVVAPFFRRSRYITTADFFERRYGKGMGALYAVMGILYFSVSTGMILRAMATIAHVVTEGAVPDWAAIAGMTVIFVAYGFAGGLVATVVTEGVQGLLIVVMSLLLVPYGLIRLGGFSRLHELVPASHFSLAASEETTLSFIIIMSFVAVIGIVAQPHIMEVCSTGKTEFEGRVGFAYGNFIKRFCAMGWVLVGLIVVALAAGGQLAPEDVAKVAAAMPSESLERVSSEIGPGQLQGADSAAGTAGEAREYAFPLAIRILLPPGMRGLMFAAIFAAQMSSLSAFMVAGSALLSRNLYKRYMKPEADDRKVLQVGRYSGLLVVALGIGFAILFQSVVEGLAAFLLLAPLTGILVWIGTLWRRATNGGAWASFLVMVPIFLLLGKAGAVIKPLLPGVEWLGKYAGKEHAHELALAYMIPGALALVIGSLLTRPRPKKVLDDFYTLLRTPVGREEELEKAGVEIVYKGETKAHPWEAKYPRLVAAGGFFVALAFALIILGIVYVLGRIGA